MLPPRMTTCQLVIRGIGALFAESQYDLGPPPGQPATLAKGGQFLGPVPRLRHLWTRVDSHGILFSDHTKADFHGGTMSSRSVRRKIVRDESSASRHGLTQPDSKQPHAAPSAQLPASKI